MRLKVLLIFVLITVTLFSAYAQKNNYYEADRLYGLKAFGEAVEKYEKHLKRDKYNIYLIKQIAYCYENMDNYTMAIQYYEQFVNEKEAEYIDRYNYARLLLMEGHFEKANTEFNKCLSINPDDKNVKKHIERLVNFENLNKLHLVDSVYNEDFNSEFTDMCPAYYQNSISFISAKKSMGGSKYSWNNQPFLDIFYLEKKNDNDFKIKDIKELNSKYHEGPMVLTDDGNTIWFSRNFEHLDEETGIISQHIGIFSAKWDGKKWTDIEPFKYNNDNYSVGHPAFSRDESTMYFSSNMEGGFGKTDIYKVTKRYYIENGKTLTDWTEPENLGAFFNTEGQEMFPFIDDRGVFYYASDGFANFGGLDIYAAYPYEGGYNMVNMGLPINSTYDDFGFIVKDDFSDGYFSSNRPGGKGSDDIYSFEIGLQNLFLKVKSGLDQSPISNAVVYAVIDGKNEPIGATDINGEVVIKNDFKNDLIFKVSHSDFIEYEGSLPAFEIFSIPNHEMEVELADASQIELVTLNEETREPVSGVDVLIIYRDGNRERLISDDMGKITHNLLNSGRIQINYFKNGFFSQREYVQIQALNGRDYSKSIMLSPIYEGKAFTLNNLYFDLNSSMLRQDAREILNNLFKLMEDYPNMKIELGSHTDCRANDDYNLKLSQERAESVVNYLVEKGIARDRMIAIGYGETQLLNHCDDGVPCTEEEHQENRRTEFKIIEF